MQDYSAKSLAARSFAEWAAARRLRSALSLAARDIAELRYIRYARRRRGVAVGHIVYTAAH
jgi:hypothetical protein